MWAMGFWDLAKLAKFGELWRCSAASTARLGGESERKQRCWVIDLDVEDGSTELEEAGIKIGWSILS